MTAWKCSECTCASPAARSLKASSSTNWLGLSTLLGHSKKTLPGSARVAAVKGATRASHCSATAGRTENLTTMKIMVAPCTSIVASVVCQMWRCVAAFKPWLRKQVQAAWTCLLSSAIRPLLLKLPRQAGGLLRPQRLAAAGGGAPLVQHSVAARGRGHEDPVAVLDHLLDIVEGGVEPAVRYLVCLADVQDLLDAFQHVRMVVLPRVAQLLGEVALPGEDDADAGHLCRHLW